ncbi:SDR family NAD(P)-dependent oxidoreductase [Pseudoclavibacter sp. VKM Ac-2888]|uniref:SDR family NAD(P)-dependent oxidoreductase n=1 Tax=Pseudoclavibacter sp. VKM Ac-2888 TaxID=2783830 RepID=UPI00188A643E|nr:SDR family NAD(P)-dependent oxidoreductase [Pseudoclavibacter sp. VKM Ac-2888]MBF4549952.1 SDR family NAD(P)-dependent oxidoreductase [Pseudoclavibacter sp. VKM Ac-2888]
MSTAQTWLITGANRGLGRALTLAALGASHNVVATVRGEHSLPEHDRLLVLPLDVRNRAAAFDVVERASSHFGAVDVLVNNAGYGLIAAAEEVTEPEARSIIDTDLLGPLWLSQAVLPGMRARGAGHIVQISTVGAVGTVPTLGLYNAAKWGLEGFSEALAAEVAGFGIRVTIVQPGELGTDWAGGSMQFSTPIGAYDDLRTQLFGTPSVPWPAPPAGVEPSGTSPASAAEAILSHVGDPGDTRLRVLIGDDAPPQVHAALTARLYDYGQDPRFPQ